MFCVNFRRVSSIPPITRANLNIGYTNLYDISLDTNVPCVYKVQARFVATWPEDVREFSHYYCPRCKA